MISETELKQCPAESSGNGSNISGHACNACTNKTNSYHKYQYRLDDEIPVGRALDRQARQEIYRKASLHITWSEVRGGSPVVGQIIIGSRLYGS